MACSLLMRAPSSSGAWGWFAGHPRLQHRHHARRRDQVRAHRPLLSVPDAGGYGDEITGWLLTRF